MFDLDGTLVLSDRSLGGYDAVARRGRSAAGAGGARRPLRRC